MFVIYNGKMLFGINLSLTNRVSIEDVLKKLSLIFHFTELSAADLMTAAGMKWDDFEDAVQAATAERIHADYIITRNNRDFKKSRVMAFTPTEFLSRF
jgi:hypothetical protein